MTENTALQEWLAMNEHDRLKYGIVYKRHYEDAYAFMGMEVPTPWEDLTHEQRMSLKQEAIRYQQEMNAFGDEIRKQASGKETKNQG